MKRKHDPFFSKKFHGNSQALRRPYKKVRRNNDRAAIEEGETDAKDPTDRPVHGVSSDRG
jgi:hypothetical protein